jgi:tryptophan 2,3-dioxygenase
MADGQDVQEPEHGELPPVLEAPGESDYERYLRTDALLALQPDPAAVPHRDELLFTTVHQSSELWLKLAVEEVAEATRLVDADDHWAAVRLLRRSALCLRLITEQLDMLEHMSPWEYHTVRKQLGHGSGFDSPGFRRVREVSPGLGRALRAALERAGLDVVTVHVRGREHEDLYQLAEQVLEWDERVGMWRVRHYKVISRIIGAHVVGTQGTPVEVLGKLVQQRFYGDLWDARDELTRLSNDSPPADVPADR